MISLERRDGRMLRIGHQGAATLAPANTLRSFRAALEAGVDLIEFDVLALRGGELVVAHSNDLREVSHGAARGGVRDKPLDELRRICPELPTFEDALRFFVEEAEHLGVHVDLKSAGRETDVVAAVRGLGLADRTFVSSAFVRTTRTLARLDTGPRAGLALPRPMLGITESGRGAPIARAGLRVLHGITPLVVSPLISHTRATALVLHHAIVTPVVVRKAHARDVAVVAWTVDTPDDLARMDAAGVDAVVTNDPRIFASTLET